MAEGGSEENPFSYQTFVKSSSSSKKSKKDSWLTMMSGNDSNKATVDGLNDPDIGVPVRKETNKLLIIDEEKTSKREENPFSLKQFLKKDVGTKPKAKMKDNEINNGSPCPSSAILSTNTKTASASEQDSTTKMSIFASGLPDFVQDHFFVDHSLREMGTSCENSSSAYEEKMREFGDDCALPGCPVENNSTDSSPVRSKSCLNENSIISSSLPDFLSDGPMFNNHIDHFQTQSETSPSHHHSAKVKSNYGICDEITLKTENEHLKKQLQQTNQIVLMKSAKIQELQDEIKLLRAKETEETTALEKVVQQVETNLQNTMQRAISAEALVARLKQEVRTLESKLNSKTVENSMVSQPCDNYLNNIRDKANSASNQIRLAANNAEQTIKQLLTGVESLKLVASYLHDIDKVTEAIPTCNKDDT